MKLWLCQAIHSTSKKIVSMNKVHCVHKSIHAYQSLHGRSEKARIQENQHEAIQAHSLGQG